MLATAKSIVQSVVADELKEWIETQAESEQRSVSAMASILLGEAKTARESRSKRKAIHA